VSTQAISVTAIPVTAVGFPFYPVVASAMPVIIGQFQANLDHDNQQAALIYAQACANWQLTNTLNREKGLPIQAKPTAPLSKLGNVARDENQTIYLWVTLGDPVGPPCPDLAALPPTPPDNNISIGKNIALGWWAALPDDTAPNDYSFTVPPAAFNVPPGKYRKVMSPWGGWWEKIA
jgi:hypothetical protein